MTGRERSSQSEIFWQKLIFVCIQSPSAVYGARYTSLMHFWGSGLTYMYVMEA